MPEIAAITQREVELVSRFIDLLTEEQAVLTRGDAPALADIDSTKITVVAQLNALEDERRSAIGMPDIQNPRQAMTEWLAAHPDEIEAAAKWAQVVELSSRAKQLHDLNVSLLTMRLHKTTEALAILTGQSRQPSLYGSNGQASQASGSRIVDSA